MIRRLFFCASVLAVPLLLFGARSVRAQSPIINPERSLIRVAHPGALAMPGMPTSGKSKSGKGETHES